ncbi:MAG TPA: methyltransferase [Flavisolibacter sp.]|nr:methyltransferase [Flavisolibacter sp.]
MANTYFQFKQFTVHHEKTAMKVTTDSCLFGAWVAEEIQKSEVRSRKSEGRSRKSDVRSMLDIETGTEEVRSRNSEVRSLLDIGTGTGLLSLMIRQKNDLNIDAVEIDHDAAQQAKENVSNSKWKKSIKVWEADIRTLPLDKRYDCIISNPPFYENELQSFNSQKNIAHHSHQLKLSELLLIIKKHLLPGGFFYLLLPAKRGIEIEELVKRNDLSIENILRVRSSVQHPIFRIFVKGINPFTQEKNIDELIIYNEERKYTPAFTALLKEYYFYL